MIEINQGESSEVTLNKVTDKEYNDEILLKITRIGNSGNEITIIDNAENYYLDLEVLDNDNESATCSILFNTFFAGGKYNLYVYYDNKVYYEEIKLPNLNTLNEPIIQDTEDDLEKVIIVELPEDVLVDIQYRKKFYVDDDWITLEEACADGDEVNITFDEIGVYQIRYMVVN